MTTLNLLEKAVETGFKCAPDSCFHATITEIQKDGQGIAWRYQAHLDLNPYPNDLKYGGYWHDYTTSDPTERDSLVVHYQEEAERCRRLGMTEVSIEKKTAKVQIKPRQEVLPL